MVKIAYAYDPNRVIVHVDQVPGGIACNCRCIECGELLVARHGSERAHCYSHIGITTCEGPSEEKLKRLIPSPESKIHATAKKIVSHNSVITTPAVNCDLSPLVDYPLPLYLSEKEKYKDAKEEYQTGGYRPDVQIITNRGVTDVEICVQHPVDNDKLAKVCKAGMRMMEITLTDLIENNKGKDPDTLYEDLCDIVLHDSSRRHWINHPYSNQIRKAILKETELTPQYLDYNEYRYCPRNYDKKGNRYPTFTSCNNCKFHRVDQTSGKEYCSTYSPWISRLSIHSIAFILNNKVCPYCGAPITYRYQGSSGKPFICCKDPLKKCRFTLDLSSTKARLANAQLSMPDYLAKA